MTQLSVNVNKIAVLRNSRGGNEPDVVRAARACLAAGAHGITVHPRPDQRHIRSDDVHALSALTREHGVELNVEGNPFAPPRAGYPGFLALCEAVRPAQATLVPDDDGQITSDHGFDFARDGARLQPLVAQLKAMGCRVSLFVDAGCEGLEQAARMGADRIELYTGPYGGCYDNPAEAARIVELLGETADIALDLGLGVNAGHDLTVANLPALATRIPQLAEVSIGHGLTADALEYGMAETVRRFCRACGQDI